jgi:hypothetical protein
VEHGGVVAPRVGEFRYMVGRLARFDEILRWKFVDGNDVSLLEA